MAQRAKNNNYLPLEKSFADSCSGHILGAIFLKGLLCPEGSYAPSVSFQKLQVPVLVLAFVLANNTV